MAHPKDTPLEQWTPGWLKLECASRLGDALYIILNDDEKRRAGYPVSVEEMIAFLKGNPGLERTPDEGGKT